MSKAKVTSNKSAGKSVINHQVNKEDVKSQKGIKVSTDASKSLFLIPIMIILCIIPFIMKLSVFDPKLSNYNWFADVNQVSDIFLYYRLRFLVLTAAVMAILIAYQIYQNRRQYKLAPIFIPLICYAILALLSSIFSKFPYHAFFGSIEQFEPIFAILSYCIIAFYSFTFVKSEADIKSIQKYLIITAILMSIIGISQLIGHDIVTSDVLYKLIVPFKYQTEEGLILNFQQIYLTLFNPNYVGAYVVLSFSTIFVMTLFQRRIKDIVISIIALIGLLVCLIGSKSLSGLIGLIVAMLCFVILMWRYIFKKLIISIPIMLIAILAIIGIAYGTNHSFYNKLQNSLTLQKTNYTLSEMETNDNNISLTYNGNKLTIEYVFQNGQTAATFIPMDNQGKLLDTVYDPNTNSILLTDKNFNGISLGVSNEDANVFYIKVEDSQWFFTNNTEDKSYYYINHVNKLDKMITAPSAVFTGYEPIASGRGYLWSRTIPLLKKNIFLGSGPDTFTLVFPQNDYLMLRQMEFSDQIVTKPHNMYLQIGVQTGVFSLIAFLVFYAMYFVTSLRLYIKGRFRSFYAQIGVAIFVSTIGYMISGLSNDSSITTAPIFWTLIGIGIAVNIKAKPLIMKEIEDERKEKE